LVSVLESVGERGERFARGREMKLDWRRSRTDASPPAGGGREGRGERQDPPACKAENGRNDKYKKLERSFETSRDETVEEGKRQRGELSIIVDADIMRRDQRLELLREVAGLMQLTLF
jgi:hypothetical protein